MAQMEGTAKKESRTEELLNLLGQGVGTLEDKLTSILRPETPEKVEPKSENTHLNQALSEINERLGHLTVRIDL